MIQVQSFTFNPFQENTYLLIDEDKNAIIIDPGMYDKQEFEVLDTFIQDNGLQVQKILLTHAHLDHVFGLQEVVEAYKVPFYLHQAEIPVYTNAEIVAANYGVQLQLPDDDYKLISEKQKISFGKEEIEIRFVPGHSPGSICFYSKSGNWVVSGDVLFQQSIGRTDLPGGDYDTLIRSVQTQLFTLPDETAVYAGHGPSTSIGLEKMNNPFFR